MSAPNSPFNFIQVIIAALALGYLNVITYFIGGSAGASWELTNGQVVSFALVLEASWIPLVFFGLLVFLLGRKNKGICKVAQWIGLIVALVSIISPVMLSADVATAVTLSAMHVITGVIWFFAVHYGNKPLHVAAAAA
ncbi:DUF6069 family protein [Glutamicibacter sp.]|uniref:DUF6069 family protein n=1 Tax=Glutamicibacter sp. TaxID=1931995 RepID=UPI0028BF3011|nr:DUF6069 family protein [Glutamicibacter sp.]